MQNIYTEENGVYCIDCTKAVWSTNGIHEVYHDAKLELSDVDFVIECGDELILLVEYKNANIPGADRPESFHPDEDKMISKISKKYYDSLHYLTLIGKDNPKRLVYVVESSKGDAVLRARIRMLLKKNYRLNYRRVFPKVGYLLKAWM